MSVSTLLATTTIPSGNPLRRTNKSIQPPVRVGKRVGNYISCSQHKQNDRSSSASDNHGNINIDRRNVLLGLGGMYGATTTIGSQSGMSAIGAPLVPPDLKSCHKATDDATGEQVSCCPPYTSANIIDFKPPSIHEKMRVRKPAHKLTSDEIAKFELAITKMKEIMVKEPDNPWGYMQQATIHCTYCNGAYNQVGSDTLLQIHGSWFFLPWHRYYLYFWERILGKLIDDPTFAIPFWNWDTPKGMFMPKPYLNGQSPLYNDLRDHSHYDALFDYGYAFGDPNPAPPQYDDVTLGNLCRIDRIFKEARFLPALFMGKPLRAGQSVPTNASGSCENLHNVAHQWTGPPTSPFYDMGNFVSAARDTMFFAHHGNVDRMWDIYSKFRGERREFRDPDWLESAFIFYDENKQVVKVKVKDCLTPQQLRYSYQPEKLPWTDVGRKCKKMKAAKKRSAGDSLKLEPVSEFGSQERTLTEAIRVIVKRPKTSRSKVEKEDASEVLLIKGLQVKSGMTARFDVYVTKPIEGLVGPDYGELAGSFVKIPHGHHNAVHTEHKASLELGITTLLEDIEAEGSETLVITLVPRHGEVSVEGIEIELVNHEDDD